MKRSCMAMWQLHEGLEMLDLVWLDDFGYDEMLSYNVMLVRWWLNITLLISTFPAWSHVPFFRMNMRIGLRNSLCGHGKSMCTSLGIP